MVSIVTPVYNSEKYLADTIKSVISQTYTSWEMIMADDCSGDRSPEIANKYAHIDDRIQVVRLTNNKGPAVARNKAIEMAEGRYIAFLDSDDIWKAKKLEKQIDFMEENNYPFTYTYYSKIDEPGNKLDQLITLPPKIAYKDLLKSNYIGCLTVIYDAKILGKMYMPTIRKRQDYGLWLKILKKVDYAYCLKNFLALYRCRTNSISTNKTEMLQYNWKIFRQIEDLSKIKSAYYLGHNVYNKLFG